MRWELRQPSSDRIEWYRTAGWWTDDTLAGVAFHGLRGAPARTAAIRVRSRTHPFSGTVGDLGALGLRLAGELSRRGIGAGDVVAFQLPNWAEAAACVYGLLPLGVTVVPIMHIYGAQELAQILVDSGARVLVTADHFGKQDHLENLEACAPDAAALELVVVVTESAPKPLPDLPCAVLRWDDAVAGAALDRPASVDPDSPAVVGYTSGTSAAPKGVIQTHRTFLADFRTWTDFAAQDVPLPAAVIPRGHITSAPVGHISGLTPLFRPLVSGSALDVIDAWDPATILAAIATDKVSAAGGAPFFLLSLLDHPDFDPQVHLPYLTRQLMGASAVPREVVERAMDLGISITRAYGSTEHPSTTASLHSDPIDKKSFTDGRLLPGSELSLRDEDGHPVGVGVPGEIHSRGPELFVGYTSASLTRDAIDGDGWYDTGDIGVIDADGYLTITDRKKDIIIRGGENVSAAEVEGLVHAMPGVAEVAVVAAPDARYGEHGVGIVRLQRGAAEFTLDDLRGHLRARGLAVQKWPEELQFVDDFPRTGAGKIRKNVLRTQLRERTLIISSRSTTNDG